MDEKAYKELAGIFKVLANPVRLKILETLIARCKHSGDKGCCVYEINKSIELPQPYISKHLKILKDHKILTYEKKGNKVHYDFCKNNTLQKVVAHLIRYNKCC